LSKIATFWNRLKATNLWLTAKKKSKQTNDPFFFFFSSQIPSQFEKSCWTASKKPRFPLQHSK
jgi:hypothetical protein